MRVPGRLIKVLVVDDSPLMREIICSILTSDPTISVVGEASDGIQAVAKSSALQPDIITMDIEMPLMNGLEAISRIMAERPVPILVITSLSGVRTAFGAVSRGALDVMQKSDIDSGDALFLINKIKVLSGINVSLHQISMYKNLQSHSSGTSSTNSHFVNSMNTRNNAKIGVVSPKIFRPAGQTVSTSPSSIQGGYKNATVKRSIVAIAASIGGPHAISYILSRLPETFPVPIVIAQHVAAGFTQGMAQWLDAFTPLAVVAAHKGDIVLAGKVYLNPSELSMRITRHGSVCLSDNLPNQLYHPSCDYLLSSVADSFGQKSVGIILSGMGSDGVAGIKAIKSAGGVTIAQDEQSSVIFGMNGLAVQQGNVEHVLPLSMIPDHLLQLTYNGGAA